MPQLKKLTKYEKPPYYAEGFSKKSYKPPWYQINLIDRTRRPIEFWGNPRNQPKVEDYGQPFIVDMVDRRLYRPTVPIGKELCKDKPATPTSRQIITQYSRQPSPIDKRKEYKKKESFHYKTDVGYIEKCRRYQMETNHARNQREIIKMDNLKSEVKETIYGQAKSLEKPNLYPVGVNHTQALCMEGKVCPKPWYNERPPTDNTPFAKWDQTMYVKYSRTRKDFPWLKPTENIPQTPANMGDNVTAFNHLPRPAGK